MGFSTLYPTPITAVMPGYSLAVVGVCNHQSIDFSEVNVISIKIQIQIVWTKEKNTFRIY